AVNHAIVGAAGDGHGRVVLLCAIDVVLEPVVGIYVVELRGGLRVLRCPGLAAVYADGGAAVIAVDHAQRVRGIDPQRVVVAVRRAQSGERAASVRGARKLYIGDVDRIRALG